jgi:hypothetical protein
MSFFKINQYESVDLYKIECISIVDDQITCVISGKFYNVDRINNELFLDKMAQVEQGVGLTQQYFGG